MILFEIDSLFCYLNYVFINEVLLTSIDLYSIDWHKHPSKQTQINIKYGIENFLIKFNLITFYSL